MVKFIFHKPAKKFFEKLPFSDQQRIRDKLVSLKNHENIFTVLVKLSSLPPATHRLRIGNFRCLLTLKAQTKDLIEFLILDIGHRREIYR